MLSHSLSPLRKKARYPHSCGELDFHMISAPPATLQGGAPFFSHRYLPLSAVTGGRFATPTEFLLQEAVRANGFRSQFWISPKQLARNFSGGHVLPDQRDKGVDIGLGRGPLLLYNIDDIAETDLQLFLRSFPIPAHTGSIFDVDVSCAATGSGSGGLPAGTHKIFDGLRWSRYRGAVNDALDALLRCYSSGSDSSSNSNSNSAALSSSASAHWIYKDVVETRRMMTVPGARAKHAFERAVILNEDLMQQTMSDHSQQQQQGNNWSNSRTPSSWRSVNVTETGEAVDPLSTSALWEAANKSQLREQIMEPNRVEITPAAAAAAGCVLFNAEQTSCCDEIEAQWAGHIPHDDISAVHRASGDVAMSMSLGGSGGGNVFGSAAMPPPQQQQVQQQQQQAQQQQQVFAAAAAAAPPPRAASPPADFWSTAAAPLEEQQKQQQHQEPPAQPQYHQQVPPPQQQQQQQHFHQQQPLPPSAAAHVEVPLRAVPPLNAELRRQILEQPQQQQQQQQQQPSFEFDDEFAALMKNAGGGGQQRFIASEADYTW